MAVLLQALHDCLLNLDEYSVSQCSLGDSSCLVIGHKRLHNHLPYGMTSRCSITVTEKEYVVHILTREVERGVLEVENAEDVVIKLCQKYSPSSREFKFCPGINVDEYDKQRSEIRFDVKSVRIMKEPFSRIDSVRCGMWFQLGKRAPKLRRDATEVLCPQCVRLRCDIQHQLKRTTSESPSKKLKRQQASSHA